MRFDSREAWKRGRPRVRKVHCVRGHVRRNISPRGACLDCRVEDNKKAAERKRREAAQAEGQTAALRRDSGQRSAPPAPPRRCACGAVATVLDKCLDCL